MHSFIDTLLEAAILVYVYLSYKKECRAVEMAELEFKYDDEWNKKMLAREARQNAAKKNKNDPFDLRDMD